MTPPMRTPTAPRPARKWGRQAGGYRSPPKSRGPEGAAAWGDERDRRERELGLLGM